MRTLLTGQSALLASGDYDVVARVWVANSSGTLVDLTNSVSLVTYDETVDAPVNAFSVSFRRGSGASSLAPLMTADPPLDLAREVVIETATIATGATPAESDYVEVHRGTIDHIDWKDRWGGVTIDGRDSIGAEMADTWIETERTYGAPDPGVDLEDVMQAVADDNLASSVAIYVPTATGSAVVSPPLYTPEGSVLDAEKALAESIGWTGRSRWKAADSAFRWTVYEPLRTKTTADFTFGTQQYYDVSAMNLAVEDIRNVWTVEYSDADGSRQTVTVSDSASIAKYGRRAAKISEASDSLIRNATLATALANAALADSKEPDAILEITTRYWWPGELGVDLYTFAANGEHFSSDQTLAPTSFRHTLPVGGRPETRIMVRGRPSGGVLSWRRKIVTTTPTVTVESDADYAVDLKEVGRTAATVIYDGPWGGKVDEVRVFEVLAAQPVSSDQWPAITGDPTQGPFTSRSLLTLAIPPQGYVRYVIVAPFDAAGRPGPLEHFTILPTGTEPDLVTGLSVLVGDADGSATIRVDVADRTASIRYAYAVGSSPSWPADATVEAGTVVALAGSTTISLPAGTVADGQAIRVRAVAYVNPDGTGKDGATDHGPIVGAEDVRRVTTSAVQAIADAAASGVADGKVTTFYQAATPTAEATGDLWIDTDDANKLYRWSGSAWVLVRDAGIAQAIADAGTAQSTADGKIVSFFQATTPTAEGVGDYWTDTDDDNHQYRWNGSAWVSIRDGKIAIAQSAADAAATAAADAQATADGKIQTFYQTGAPTAGSVGDLWVDTDDSNKLYRWSGSAWVLARDSGIAQAITDAAGAQATADGKVTTFYQTTAPTAEGTGDLWVDTDDNNKLYRWDGSAWVSARDLASYAPTVKSDLTRSGTTATLTLTVQDALLRTTATQWSSQSQGGTATAFSATWSSSTGVAGTDSTLTRTKTFTVADGADLAVRYQVTFTDATGASKTISDTLTLSNLASVTKTIRIPYTALVPFRDITTWIYDTDSLSPGSLGTETFRGAVVLPKGVTITGFSCRMKAAGASDSADAYLYKVTDTPAATQIAHVSAASGGWGTASAALSQLVGNETYTWEVDMDANATATDVAVMWAEFTYTVPTYATTY